VRSWRLLGEGSRIVQDYMGVRAPVPEGVDTRPSERYSRPWYRGSRHTDFELFEVNCTSGLAGETDKPPGRTLGIRRYKCGIAGDEALFDGEDGLEQT
jgi:hypothetical protein